MPIHHIRLSESEVSELQLDSYVVHIHQQACLNCDCRERFSHLFEVWTHPTKTRTTGFRDLRLTSDQPRDLPIAVVELPERSIPLCSDCAETYDRPGLPAIQPISRSDWEATLKRKYTPEPPAPRPQSRPTPTLDQL
jgi:hypothetical protein